MSWTTMATGLLLLTTLLFAAVPTGSAIACAEIANPFPPSPVGGQVGATYDFATGETVQAANFAWDTTCGVAGYAVGTTNDACVFLTGVTCIDLA